MSLLVDLQGGSLSREGLASEALKPANLISLSGGSYGLADATTGKNRVLAGQSSNAGFMDVDDSYASGEAVKAIHVASGKPYVCRLAAGQNVAEGAILYPAASGEVTGVATAGSESFLADESIDNSGGASAVLIKVIAL